MVVADSTNQRLGRFNVTALWANPKNIWYQKPKIMLTAGWTVTCRSVAVRSMDPRGLVSLRFAKPQASSAASLSSQQTPPANLNLCGIALRPSP